MNYGICEWQPRHGPRGEGTGIALPEVGAPLAIGKGRIVRQGNSVALLSFGARLQECCKAADELAAYLVGISVTRVEAWTWGIGVGILGVVVRRHGTMHGTIVAAMARWNVWNWGQTQARVGRSRAEHAAAQQAQRAHRQQVEFEVRAAWLAVDAARARHDVAAQAVTSAERAAAILDDRFGQGVAKITDVLDAYATSTGEDPPSGMRHCAKLIRIGSTSATPSIDSAR